MQIATGFKPLMITRIVILFIMFPYMTHGQQHKKDSGEIVVVHGQFTVTEDDEGPPPPNLKSKFQTVQDWLVDMCSKDKPKKPIAIYNIGFLESTNSYTLSLTGVNTYEEGNNRSTTRIEFSPKNMYYKLPEAYHKNLSREQVIKKLTAELKDFSNTEEFKKSFFTQANFIVFQTNGEKIWSK